MKKLLRIASYAYIACFILLLGAGCTKKVTSESSDSSEASIPHDFDLYEMHQDRSTYGTLMIFRDHWGRRIFIVTSPNGNASVAAFR